MPKHTRAKINQNSIIHKHLTELYNDLPNPGSGDSSRLCLNGHVLYIYLQNSSSTITAEAISSRFGLQIKSQKVDHLIGLMQKLKKKIGKNLPQFKELCNKVFAHVPTATVPEPTLTSKPAVELCATEEPLTSTLSLSSTDAKPDVLIISGQHSKETVTDSFVLSSELIYETDDKQNYNLRQEECTPRKKKLKKRISYLSQSRIKDKEQYKKNLAGYKAKVKHLPNLVRVLKQSIKRKNSTITLLRQELKNAKRLSGKDAYLKMKSLYTRERQKTRELLSKSKDTSYLLKQLEEKNERIRQLEHDYLLLEEKCNEEKQLIAKKDKKTYSSAMRLLVYEAIDSEVSTGYIPTIIANYAKLMGITAGSIPQRSSAEEMERELGVIAQYQAADVAMSTQNLTLGFDATTQEDVHVNAIHITTKNDCFVLALDALSGGTAEDYEQHITSAVDDLAHLYADYKKLDYESCRETIINNISNTMSDRAAVNHATIRRVCDIWQKPLNELKCNLHPLDTIASRCKAELKTLETKKGYLYGKECMAANLVLQINKLRFINSKGDPKGFVCFLIKNNLPKGLIPRYRGNRLHILFHICGLFIHHYTILLDFLRNYSLTCGGLQSAVEKDFCDETAKKQMCALGMVGKLLTAPWLKLFYIPKTERMAYFQAIEIIKDALERIKKSVAHPLLLFSMKLDFFNNAMDAEDPVWNSLIVFSPKDEELENMLKLCLIGVAEVIEKQYVNLFDIIPNEDIEIQTETCRPHNMDSEELMGMFSAAKAKSPNATMCFISSKICAKKNKTMKYLYSMTDPDRDSIISWAIGAARSKRKGNRFKNSELLKEMQRRSEEKKQKKEDKKRKDVEKMLKNIALNKQVIKATFPEMTDTSVDQIYDLLAGKASGRRICHTWHDNGPVIYLGRIERLKKNDPEKYVVAYWKEGDDDSLAEDYDISKLSLACDVVFKDLIMS